MEKTKRLLDRQGMYFLIVGISISWFAFSFLLLPNFNVIKDTFFVNGSISIEPIQKILHSERAMKSIYNSFLLAITLSITVNIVGFFIVLVTEYFDIKGANILRIGYMTTLVFGGVVLASGYLYVYGDNGILTRLIASVFPGINTKWFVGYPAVIFMMTFACTSNHMLFLRNAIRGIDYQTVEAARNMGASQWLILRKVVLPTLTPVLITLTIVTFQTGIGAMSGPLMVGGKDFQTIAPMILTFAERPTSRSLAAVLSLFLGLFQMILLAFLTRNERKGNYMSISKTKTKITKQKITNPVMNVVVHVISWSLFLIYSIPVILVILFSFTDTVTIGSGQLSMNSFTLVNYKRILTDVNSFKPFLTSVVYSAVSALIAVAICLLLARLIMKYKNKITEIMEYIFYIPWLLPSLMLAIGLMTTYDKPMPNMFNKVLIGTVWIMLIAYIVILIPSTLRYIKSAYFSFDNNLEEAARNLGASGMYTFRRVVLPILLPTALALFALNFNGRLADYDLSAFLYHPLFPTLGIVIRQNADPAATVDAKAINLVYSVILMVINTLVLYFVYGRGSALGERKRKKKQKAVLEKINVQQ